MLIVVMGVSGSGKTAVGSALADALNGSFHDADDYHPAENIAKMARGVPLSEQDRRPWIDALRPEIERWRRSPGIVVLACSALTERIRNDFGLRESGVSIVHLEANRPLLKARLRSRRHFMAPELLASQLELLERPTQALVLDAARPIDTLVAEIRKALHV